MKILIAEDNVVSAAYLKEILEQQNATVDVVYDGEAAYMAAITNFYDLIFMDFKMPLMDGIVASRKIKLELVKQNKPSTTIIACCASDNSDEKFAWNEIGVKEIVIKPVSTEIIERVINNKRIKHQPPTHPNIEKKQLYSDEKIVGMSRGNNQFVTKMIDLFVADTPVAIENIKTSIANKDYQRVKAIVHRIKPSFKMMCIDSIENDIQNIEQYCQQNNHLDKLPELFNNVKKTCEKVISEMRSRND
jgi:DNA-binding response OmpR family regulator